MHNFSETHTARVSAVLSLMNINRRRGKTAHGGPFNVITRNVITIIIIIQYIQVRRFVRE